MKRHHISNDIEQEHLICEAAGRVEHRAVVFKESAGAASANTSYVEGLWHCEAAWIVPTVFHGTLFKWTFCPSVCCDCFVAARLRIRPLWVDRATLLIVSGKCKAHGQVQGVMQGYANDLSLYFQTAPQARQYV